jgi:uncharacterized cupredoxin-like copper-binding protein
MALVVVLLGALTAGCANDSMTMGHRNGPRSTMARGFGLAMMGSVPPGYHMSRLSCTAPSSLPGTTVHVMLGDMGTTRVMRGAAPVGAHMMLRALPPSVSEEEVSFVVANMGWRTHEMVVLPLPPGQAAGKRTPGPDGRVAETGSVGEVSASCAAGSGEGIKPGTVGWVTLALPEGRYELVCNLRNHYADGMHQAFLVN